MTRGVTLIPLIALLTISAVAYGQAADTPDDALAAADALFNEGLDLVRAGKYEQACAKFEASYRFDPSVGTMLNLGNCHEELGHVAVAFAYFSRAAEKAGREGETKRMQYANQRLKRLEGTFAWVIVEISADARVDGLEIMRDDMPIDPYWWNRPAPIDTGTWTIRARAPGARPFETRIEVKRTDEEITVRIPVLEPVARPQADSGNSAPAPGHGNSAPGSEDAKGMSGAAERGELALPATPSAPRDEHDMSLSRKLALGFAGAGAVAIVGGSVLAWRAHGQYADARAICDNYNVETCTGDERDRSQAGREQARATANLATIAFAVSAAAVATGVILWVVQPGAPATSRTASGSSVARSARIHPVLGSGGAGIQMHVSF